MIILDPIENNVGIGNNRAEPWPYLTPRASPKRMILQQDARFVYLASYFFSAVFRPATWS